MYSAGLYHKKTFSFSISRIYIILTLLKQYSTSLPLQINYDMPPDSDSYLHRVGRAGRFGTKGLAITFCAGEEDVKVSSIEDLI